MTSSPINLTVMCIVLFNLNAAALQEAWAGTEGMKSGRLDIDGVSRTFHSYVPRTSSDENIPLLLVFHGGLGNGTRVAKQTGFNRIAEREGFVVVYPDSIEYWNDGRLTTGVSTSDTNFVLDLIDHLATIYRVDRARVYATGISNGGMFTLRLACELSNTIAAFAPVSASFPVSYHPKCNPKRAVPILMIHGTDDTFIRWRGGTIRKGRKRGAGGEVISVPDTVEFWRERNTCVPNLSRDSLPDRDPKDNTRVEVLRYDECGQNSSVELVRIVGGGHTWPGTDNPLPPRFARLVGSISYDISASETIWLFVSRFTMN